MAFSLTGNLISQTNTFVETYNSSTNYNINDQVSFNGNVYSYSAAGQSILIDFANDTSSDPAISDFDFPTGQISTTNSVTRLELRRGSSLSNTFSIVGNNLRNDASTTNFATAISTWVNNINTNTGSISLIRASVVGSDIRIFRLNRTETLATPTIVGGFDPFGAQVSSSGTPADGLEPGVGSDWTFVSVYGDADLSGLLDSTGNNINSTFSSVVSLSFVGTKRRFTFSPNVRIDVSGNLVLSPEELQLNFESNNCFRVLSGGTLQFGKVISKIVGPDTTIRFSEGLLMSSSRPQTYWWGGVTPTPPNSSVDNNHGASCTIRVESGGSFIGSGATTTFPGGYAFLDGCAVYIDELNGVDGLIHKTQDIRIGDIDPKTGVAGVDGTGTFTFENLAGTTLTGGSKLALSAATDSYFTWMSTTDAYITGLNMIGGGQMGIKIQPAGTNSINTSLSNVHSLKANQSNNGGLTSQAVSNHNYTFINTAISLRGNNKDISMQSQSGSAGVPTICTVINEIGGSAIRFISDSSRSDGNEARNWGYYEVSRDFNFNITSANDGSNITGGRYFLQDTNNGLRLNENGRNNTADQLFSNALTNGSETSNINLKLGIVNVPSGTRLPNTSNDPANTETVNSLFRMDIRGKVNEQGSDLFDIYFWHPEYNPVVFENEKFSDETVGTKIIQSAPLEDVNYSNTATGKTLLNDLNEVYDYIKQRKSAGTASDQIRYPTLGTLAVSNTFGFLNVGVRNVSASTSLSSPYTITDPALVINTDTNLVQGANIFNGIVTTGDIDAGLIDTSTVRLDSTNITNLNTDESRALFLKGKFENSSFSQMTFGSFTNVENLELVFNSSTTVSIFGKAQADFTGFTPRNVHPNFSSDPTLGVIYPLPQITTTFQVDAVNPTGWATLLNVTDSVIESEVYHTAGSPTVLLQVENTSVTADQKTYRLMYKPRNVFNQTGILNQLFQTTFVVDTANSSLQNETIRPLQIAHADVLTRDAENVELPIPERAVIELANADATTANLTLTDADGTNSTGRALSNVRTQRMLLQSTENEPIMNMTFNGTYDLTKNGPELGTTISQQMIKIAGINTIRIGKANSNTGSALFTLDNTNEILDISWPKNSSGTATGNEVAASVLRVLKSFSIPQQIEDTDGNNHDLQSIGGVFSRPQDNVVRFHAVDRQANLVPSLAAFTETGSPTFISGADFNKNQYLRLLANNKATRDIILPVESDGTDIDHNFVTLRSPTQQFITAVFFSGEATSDDIDTIVCTAEAKEFESVIVFPNPAGLTSSEAEGATGIALDRRGVTLNNQVNIGLGTPVVKPDNTLGTTFTGPVVL